ncbi:MAG: efflux RND transporter permease subunit, partial [Spirochaetia bacterium]|nr:efflux RND transporter permease subunit [Spirochaetia bacterium]
QVVVSTAENGTPVHLSQVATVEDGYKERRGASFHNGAEAVIVGLKKEPSKNTIETAANIRAALGDVNRRFEKQIRLELIQDRSTYISDAIDSVKLDAFQGGFLAFLVLFFFLKDIRSALIVALTIPVAVIATFIPMYVRGISINLMSLGGLSLGLGMLIDNSIVVLEAILAEREANPDTTPVDAAVIGTRRVMQSVVASTLTSAVVFLPIIFVSGIAGEVFRDLALTVTFSSFASFFASLSLIPMLAAVEPDPAKPVGRVFLFLNTKASPVFRRTESLVSYIRNSYRGVIGYAIANPARVLVVSAALSAAGGLLFLVVKKSLFPAVDQGVVVSDMDLPGGTPLDGAAEFHTRIHSFLEKNAMSVHAVTNLGFDEDDIASRVKGVRKPNHAESTYYINPDKTDSASFIAALRTGLAKTSSVDANFRIKGDALQELLGTATSTILFNIDGRDRGILRDAAHSAAREIASVSPDLQVRSSAVAEDPEIQVHLDRTRIAALGLTPESIGGVVRTAVNGSVATVYREGDTEIDVRLRLSEKDRRSPEALHGIFVEVPQGGLTAVGPILSVREGYGHPTFLRQDQRSMEQLRITFPSGAEGRAYKTLETVREKLEKGMLSSLAEENRPEIRIETENQETVESLRNLVFAFVISSVLIYMLLAAQFESLLHPVTLSLAIPMMLSGVSISLLLTGHTLNITSATGMILLTGIVVNNALILYEYIQERREELAHEDPGGDDLARLPMIILESGRERIRPILLTSMSSILGLLPLALGIGQGAELQAPMAVVMIGGMTVSSVLTLVAFPTLFLLMETWRLKGFSAVVDLLKRRPS